MSADAAERPKRGAKGGGAARPRKGYSWRDGTMTTALTSPDGDASGALKAQKGGVVLIVDDDEDVRGAVRLSLPREFELVGVPDGEDFLSVVESYHPDLVILDVHMPGEDGFQLCRRLRASESFRAVPVLFLTVLDEDVGFVELLKVHGDAYLNKPFDPHELLETVRRLIGGTTP